MAEAPSDQTKKKAAKPPKHPCLRCRKAVTKEHKSVQCQTCQFWVHVECEGMSEELFKILAEPERFGGVCWNCDSCLASIARLERKVVDVEKRVKEVETLATKTAGDLKKVDDEVAILRRELETEKAKSRAEAGAREERFITGEELREREGRRCNVLMHRVKEPAQTFKTMEERRNQDMEECKRIFTTMGMESSEGNDDIRFCRRIGEAGEEPRPLVVIMRTKELKRSILEKARNLRDTVYQEVGIVPDLTLKQRREEQNMAEEVEKKNEQELTDEDRAKNLQWLLVGPRGAKKIIKGVPREYQERRGPGGSRGGTEFRGRGRPRTRGGIATGANVAALGASRSSGQSEAVQLVRNLLPPRELLPSTVRITEAVTGRTRMGSKRLREDGTEMETGEDTEEEEEFRSPGRSPVRKK